ncbi:MAG TPA: type I-MYXAN CRISPR-associated protein Cas6/Cmx6 [Burkholderiales bacterium]|nr:type I-MYXAN CRISPR-associated protein Cas6/Cmx6 [Burkholderiales bacterium]
MQRDLEISAASADLRFALHGERLPADHGEALADAVTAELPWLAAERNAGIHAVRGAPMQGALLGISRRARLALRLPRARLAQARSLAGRSLRVGAETLRVGEAAAWPLASSDTLYSRLVIAGPAEEQAFAAALEAQLAAEFGTAVAACQMVLGKPGAIATRAGTRRGFSVLLHGMSAEVSLELQERGLGELRLFGCGIVVPYKSIAAV